MKRRNSILSGYLSDDLNKIRFITLVIFTILITLLAWQSDDAYHAYAMAENLVNGHGFVYNIGERASASSCPLFTLVVAAGYFIFRNMFLVSLLICIIFSAAAYGKLVYTFCEDRTQVIVTFIIFISSVSFMSYTTAGLENCMLFFLAVLFFKKYFGHDDNEFDVRGLLYMSLLISLIAMTRMDAVLMFVPAVLYVYLCKRKHTVSFIKACGIGFLGLCPFILWELFSLFYYGFFVPNTAFVKLGTDIPRSEYLKRGVMYIVNAVVCDPIIILLPLSVIITTVIIKKLKYIYPALGALLYLAYIVYIGGDFMMGRHFTVVFFICVTVFLEMYNYDMPKGSNILRNARIINTLKALVIACLVYSVTAGVINNQFKFGETFNSPISDERASYFKWTSLFNNAVSYFSTGEMCIRDAWNEQGIQDLREGELDGGIIVMIPGISKYYNNDMYLNDLYALGDPFLSKLPAVREDNWRIGHMYRESPDGYNDMVMYGGEERIVNDAIRDYYKVIKLITRGNLFDSQRIQAIIDINLGRYDYLIDEYRKTLDENNRQLYIVP